MMVTPGKAPHRVAQPGGQAELISNSGQPPKARPGRQPGTLIRHRPWPHQPATIAHDKTLFLGRTSSFDRTNSPSSEGLFMPIGQGSDGGGVGLTKSGCPQRLF